MAGVNGGRLARTFVAELGGGESSSEYLARAKCTRCVPTWMGPVHRLSDVLERTPSTDYADALELVRDECRIDVLRHCDRAHSGRLRS